MGGDPWRSAASDIEGQGGAGAEFTVRTSARARHVRLVMSMRDGLVVVVPHGFDRRGIRGILKRKAGWIERAAARVESRRRMEEAEPQRLPDHIALAAVGEVWEVEYLPGSPPVSGARIRERSGERLLVTGAVNDIGACQEALRRWSLRKAREVLAPALAEIAHEHGFEVGRVSVRRQRTRWGSCSPRKTISLNVKLLFLSPTIVEYVLLHELCHTVRMDHSPAFWALLESHDPDYRRKKKLLRQAGEAVPTWIDHQMMGADI